MKYMFLIYSAETAGPKPGTDEFGKMIADYGTFTKNAIASGHFEGGAPLEGVDTATTVRVRGGKSRMTDGPFAETKEVLGGYYLMECKDLDEALGLAAQIPTAAYGSIEVRAVSDVG